MSLLITEVKDVGDKQKKREYETMEDLRKEKSKESSYLIYHEKGFNKAETKVVEYLLTDETMYTSIEKAEGLYITRLEENKKKLDGLTLILRKLKNDEKFISTKISEETVTNVVHGTEAIERKYQNKIDPLYPEIEGSNHSLQVYRNKKEELIQENIRLKQQLNDEYKQSRMRNDQWKKFNIIDNSIKSEAVMKEKLYRTMTAFGTKAKKMYEEKEEKKNCQKYLKEKDLERFKKDALEMERQMNKIIQKRQRKEMILPDEEYRNNKLYSDNAAIRKENNLNLIKLEAIKKNIHVKDYDTAIAHFKEMAIKFESSYNQYNKLMRDLAELQGMYSKECTELKQIQDMIELKQEKHTLINDDPMIIQHQREINEINVEIELVTQKCDAMELLIKKIFIFINTYNKDTSGIIRSILINDAKLTVFCKTTFDDIIQKYFDNKESNSDILKFTSIKRIEQANFEAIVKCILKYLRTWNVIYFNFLIELRKHYFSIRIPKTTEGHVSEYDVTDYIDQQFESEIKQKRIKNNIDKLVEENKMKSGIIHTKQQLDKIMAFDDSKYNSNCTVEELFQRFLINYNRQMSEKEEIYSDPKNKNKKKELIDERESMKILVSKLRNKFFIHLSGYVNELVEKYQKPKLDYSKLNLTNSEGNANKRVIQKQKTVIQGIMDLIKKNAPLNNRRKLEDDELEDSYHEDMQKPMSNNKKGGKYRYYESLYTNPNTNNATMLNRMNDLHKLNFELFHNRSNRMVYDEINSVCAKTMNSKSFFKLMKQKSNERNEFKKKRTLKNNTDTTETNNRLTVTNDRGTNRRVSQMKTMSNMLN